MSALRGEVPDFHEPTDNLPSTLKGVPLELKQIGHLFDPETIKDHEVHDLLPGTLVHEADIVRHEAVIAARERRAERLAERQRPNGVRFNGKGSTKEDGKSALKDPHWEVQSFAKGMPRTANWPEFDGRAS